MRGAFGAGPSRWSKEALAVCALAIVGLLLRLPGLRLGLWRDEAATYFDALPASLHGLLARVAYSELNPPGFFLVMLAWLRAFGADETLFKLPAFAFGVLLIPAVYALGRAAGSSKAGLLAAGITSFAPEAVY
jgi:4-amino-4-deoxy-L-arabinose transferase-like glycosyltransferase